MPRLSRRAIERAVAELLDELEIKKPPVSVQDVARALGATIERAPGEDNISGMLYREGERIVIGVNSSHAPQRQRFSIAHEIGHLRLHARNLYLDHNFDSEVFWRDSVAEQGDDDDEIEANQFAAALLMPRHFLEEDVNNGRIALSALAQADEAAIAKLADRYKVSSQAMAYRLINTGLI